MRDTPRRVIIESPYAGDTDDEVADNVAFAERAMLDSLLRVVLTVARLDHTPENCEDDNLRAMCQACHLAYDHEHHAANRARSREAKLRGDTLALPFK